MSLGTGPWSWHGPKTHQRQVNTIDIFIPMLGHIPFKFTDTDVDSTYNGDIN